MASDRPMVTMAKSAWNWVTFSQSNGIRLTEVPSPECGPVPVARVPATISSAVTAMVSRDRWSTGRPTVRTGSPSPSRVRCHIASAARISSIEVRKCTATTNGLRCDSTVMPPSTASTTMIQNWAQPSLVTPRRQGLPQRAAMIARPTRAQTRSVSIRLVNSMIPWTPIAAVGARSPPVQVGQVGQPRPEPVSRTAPPVTTISTLATRVANAVQRITRSGTVTRSASREKGVRTEAS